MKVIPQYKVIGPLAVTIRCFNYDRIIRNIENNYAQRQDIGHTNRKMQLILKIKICAISKRFQTH